MCSVSFVGQTYREQFPARWPNTIQPNTQTIVFNPVTRDEFDALKREVELLREMLVAAKEYDDANGEPDCEMDEKVEFLKAVAEFVGVDLTEVFG